MYTTLNNEISKHIVMCAVRGQYRFCAYSLYNHYKADTFNQVAYKHLFVAVRNLLGYKAVEMYEDDTIDFCVRDFIERYNRLSSLI